MVPGKQDTWPPLSEGRVTVKSLKASSPLRGLCSRLPFLLLPGTQSSFILRSLILWSCDKSEAVSHSVFSDSFALGYRYAIQICPADTPTGTSSQEVVLQAKWDFCSASQFPGAAGTMVLRWEPEPRVGAMRHSSHSPSVVLQILQKFISPSRSCWEN